MTPDQVKRAARSSPQEGDFAWDGTDEDDRPATPEELQSVRRGRGRPAGSGTKEQVALRIDREALARWRASGPGWQTRAAALLAEKAP